MGGVSRDCLGIHRSHCGYEAVETLVSGSFGGGDVVVVCKDQSTWLSFTWINTLKRPES